MKTKYNAPEMDIVCLGGEDVIVTSGGMTPDETYDMTPTNPSGSGGSWSDLFG